MRVVSKFHSRGSVTFKSRVKGPETLGREQTTAPFGLFSEKFSEPPYPQPCSDTNTIRNSCGGPPSRRFQQDSTHRGEGKSIRRTRARVQSWQRRSQCQLWCSSLSEPRHNPIILQSFWSKVDRSRPDRCKSSSKVALLCVWQTELSLVDRERGKIPYHFHLPSSKLTDTVYFYSILTFYC